KNLNGLERFFAPRVFSRWCDETDAALEAILEPMRGAHPDSIKDKIYFEHRIQGCMNIAAYPKQIVLDHRAPLLDETILDFLARVPARLRDDRVLFRRAAAATRPSLWEIPLARHGNLEHWPRLLAERTPVRAFAERELHDVDSPFWEIANRAALIDGLRGLKATPTREPTIEERAKKVIRGALSVLPPVERALTARSHRGSIRFDQILLRM